MPRRWVHRRSPRPGEARAARWPRWLAAALAAGLATACGNAATGGGSTTPIKVG